MLPLLVGSSINDGDGDGDGDGASAWPDLLLIDHSVNDATGVQDWTGPQDNAAPGSGVVKPEMEGGSDAIAGALDAMLRYLCAKYERVAILLIFAACCARSYCPSWLNASTTNVAHAYTRVANAYGVPLVRYAGDMVAACTPSTWDAPPASAHPHLATHQRLAYGLTSWLGHVVDIMLGDSPPAAEQGPAAAAERPAVAEQGAAAVERASAAKEEVQQQPPSCARRGPALGPTVSEALRARYDLVCVSALSRYDARAALKLVSRTADPNGTALSSETPPGPGVTAGVGWRVLHGDWKLMEDRVEKPGWVTRGTAANDDSLLEFAVRFGRSPRLTIVYDESYEGFGEVELTLVNTTRWTNQSNLPPPSSAYQQSYMKYHRKWITTRHKLDARRDDGVHATQTVTAALNVKQVSAVHGGFSVPPYASLALHVRSTTPNGKFKIRLVTSC